MISTPWLVVKRPRPLAKLRLVCFPYAGGAAHVYSSWAEQLPDWIEMCAVDLPGRGARFREPLCNSMEQLIGPLASAIGGLSSTPYAFFGHSMGAAVAFELVLRGVGAPEIFFASARPAPHRFKKTEPVHALPYDEFAAKMARSFYCRFEEPLPAELLELFLPVLRADYTLSENHAYSGGRALQCPVHAYHGTDDQSVNVEEVEAWRELTSGEFSLTKIPGNHFFVHGASDLVLRSVVSILTSWNQRR